MRQKSGVAPERQITPVLEPGILSNECFSKILDAIFVALSFNEASSGSVIYKSVQFNYGPMQGDVSGEKIILRSRSLNLSKDEKKILKQKLSETGKIVFQIGSGSHRRVVQIEISILTDKNTCSLKEVVDYICDQVSRVN